MLPLRNSESLTCLKQPLSHSFKNSRFDLGSAKVRGSSLVLGGKIPLKIVEEIKMQLLIEAGKQKNTYNYGNEFRFLKTQVTT